MEPNHLVKINNEVRLNLHYLARTAELLWRRCTITPKWALAADELRDTYTKLRLAYRWLGLYDAFLLSKYDDTQLSAVEDDALPGVNDFFKVSEFMLRELDDVMGTMRRAPVEAYTADAKAINYVQSAGNLIQESIFLITMAQAEVEKVLRDEELPDDEGDIGVQS